jgi:hypothetical protein
MAYAHFEDHDEVIVSARLGTNPPQLADFILGSVVKAHEESLLLKRALQRFDSNASATRLMSLEGGEGSGGAEWDEDEISPTEASHKAIGILRETIGEIEKHIRSLQGLALSQSSTSPREGAVARRPHITTPEIMQRYSAVTSRSPRSSHRPPVPGQPGARTRKGSSSNSPLMQTSVAKDYSATATSGSTAAK